MSVLIAESSPAVALSVASAFQSAGFSPPRIVHDGVAALRLARQKAPRIVTVDLILPGLSGLQVARALSALPNRPLLIAISAVTARHRLAQAKEAGIRYYILKPLDNRRLTEILTKHLGSDTFAATAR